MKKKVLILGAKGNLGHQLDKLFSADSTYTTIGWDREEIDITDKELISKKIGELKPHIILNCAAHNGVDAIERDEEFEKAKRLNSDAPGFLADAAIKARSMIVHFSSDNVFKGTRRAGYTEEDKPEPVNRYGLTKLGGEQEVLKRSGKQLKWYIIRVSRLFGPQGLSPQAKPSFFDIMLALAKDKREAKLVDSEYACFTYTPELASRVKALIESGKGSGIYHLANTGAPSWLAAGRELYRQANIKMRVIPVKPEDFPRPAKRPKYSALLNTKLPPLRLWREALAEHLQKMQ